MSDVQRYGEIAIDSPAHSRMAEIDDGPWVKHSDYKALVDKLGSRQWIQTAERIPEPEVSVLCYGWSDLNKRMYVFVDWFGSKRDAGRGVTHWMPLPEPPK